MWHHVSTFPHSSHNLHLQYLTWSSQFSAVNKPSNRQLCCSFLCWRRLIAQLRSTAALGISHIAIHYHRCRLYYNCWVVKLYVSSNSELPSTSILGVSYSGQTPGWADDVAALIIYTSPTWHFTLSKMCQTQCFPFSHMAIKDKE